jgi:hypothetical protein
MALPIVSKWFLYFPMLTLCSLSNSVAASVEPEPKKESGQMSFPGEHYANKLQHQQL